MSHKYSVVVVAYKSVTPDVEAIINSKSIRTIDEPSDLVKLSGYGRQFDQNSRFDIYLKWYQENIRKYLDQGYKVVVLELPYASTKPTLDTLKSIDEKLGDQVLIIEHDEV